MVAGGTSDLSFIDGSPVPCDDPKDAMLYWKSLAEEYMQKLKDTKEEFDEYQDGSRELEAELDTQLKQYEQRVKDLINDKTKLEDENEDSREKLETIERQSYAQIIDLQDENTQSKTVREEMTKYIRELEQTNDDLERTKRATISSLEEFDTRLSNAIERNVLLENELEEKEQLIIAVQRLKDESRELKEELAVSNNNTINDSKTRLDGGGGGQMTLTENFKLSSKLIDDIGKMEKMDIGGVIDNPLVKFRNSCSKGKVTSRISALKIVADILQKVSAMETKLSRYRNIMDETPPVTIFHSPTQGNDSAKGKKTPKNVTED